MAVYKVPQDVEADDKLIGPFSFRQFIYLIIVALACGGSWGLAQLFLPLLIIPIPIIIFFGALALPLRKDQPMEIFMAAMVSFYLKPRRRMWNPDGIDLLIEITAPKTEDIQLTKDLAEDEAKRRINYLANVLDSQGWSVRGVDVKDSPLNSDVVFEAEQANDIMNDSNTTQTIDYKLNQSDEKRHQDMINIVSHKQTYKPIVTEQIPVEIPNYNNNPIDPQIKYNPYPNQIKQSVVQPFSSEYNTNQTVNTSENAPSADIINLASNSDLSIETIAREANRTKNSRDQNDEVIISFR